MAATQEIMLSRPSGVNGVIKQIFEPKGSLSVSWEVRQDEKQSLLLFDWNEAGVAISAPPKRKGFGRDLIERALAFTLTPRPT